MSGPTGHEVSAAALGKSGQYPFNLIEVETPAAIPPAPLVPAPTLATMPPPPTDLLGPGDVLNISIYEAGVSLFGTALRTAAAVNGAVDTSSTAERLPSVRVDDYGYIKVPFVGRLRAAGHTAAELQQMIQRGLRGMSQDPQVMVSIEQPITNTVILAGEVTKPGRLALATNRESLVDAIALAGGYRGDAKDAVARVQRGGQSFEIRLSDLFDMPQEDIQIAPGDRITLISRPQSFSVLGAPNKTEELAFPRARLTLAEAVALGGGANPNSGDAAAIFVFRYVRKADGSEQPTVYHLNMMRPGAYLLSQRFLMRDRDVLYVGNARANQLTKFVNVLSQLVLPIATARAVCPSC
ncbi:MAG TPA: polysaccharide biosynthesis/export family protein [Sphingomicrobium sp.]|nr:polysaccharide biosynthesis/export family protein [Sphingomicrobium sp.]